MNLAQQESAHVFTRAWHEQASK